MFPLLSMSSVTFPQDFLFGTATASYQIEGNCIHSQLWEDERKQPDRFPDKSGSACNFWELYPQDIELFHSLGWKVFRMSMEWSRLEPEPGVHDQQALRRYLDMLERLAGHGIRVSMTLDHWSRPLWFEQKGGFQKRENLRHFLDYIDYIVPKVRDYVDTWIVMNEFTNDGMSRKNFEMMKNLTVAHGYGYHAVKQHTDAPVSSTHALVAWAAENECDPLDRMAAQLRDWSTNAYVLHALKTGEMVLPYMDGEFLPELKGTYDFWAINYYTRHYASARKEDLSGERYPHNRFRMIDMPFYLEEFYPDGLVQQLPRFRDKPIWICENGVCADDDRFRIVYLAQHLTALREAMRLGCDVRGYLHWSAMDNWEWGSYKPRFGLVGVDFESQKRTVRPSALFYKDVIAQGGITEAIVEKWLRPLCDFKTYPIG